MFAALRFRPDDVPLSVDKYVELFDFEMKRILDIHAPLQSRTRRVGRNDCRWLSDEARKAKRSCRPLERRCRRMKSSTDQLSLNAARSVSSRHLLGGIPPPQK